MHELSNDAARRKWPVFLCALAIVGFAPALLADAFVAVPEMEVPPDILVAPRAQRLALADEPAGVQAVAALRRHVSEHWKEIRALDVAGLSQYHVEPTRGWRAPAEPELGDARVIGRAADGGHWFVELRGPRLPAKFDIVHRHLVFYARYAEETAELDRVAVTIRLELFE